MKEFEISDDQVDDFERDGFIVVDRIISDEEVASLRERYDLLFKGQRETGLVPDESFFPVTWRKDGYRSHFIEPYSARRITWGEALPT